MRTVEVRDAPECIECGGKCCRLFNIFVRHDKRPWSRRRALKRIAHNHEHLFSPTGKTTISNGFVFVECTCNAIDEDGRCRSYECRPDTCKSYPNHVVIAQKLYHPYCLLSERLRRRNLDELLLNIDCTGGLE